MEETSTSITRNDCDDDVIIQSYGICEERSDGFRQFVVDQLRSHGCHRVLDAACGTGPDSLVMLEAGFDVVGSDHSEAMLHYARKERDARFGENNNNNNKVKWDIHRADWLTLVEDLPGYGNFDGVVCMGNSLIHLVDSPPELKLYRKCFENFKAMLKPGGVLLIDHRNMDYILDTGTPINRNVYFKNDNIRDISSEVVKEGNEAVEVKMTFLMRVKEGSNCVERTTVGYCPFRIRHIEKLVQDLFGEQCKHSIFGDFQPIGVVEKPAYIQHVLQFKN